jgi:uncharacterized protein (DUF2147 family)
MFSWQAPWAVLENLNELLAARAAPFCDRPHALRQGTREPCHIQRVIFAPACFRLKREARMTRGLCFAMTVGLAMGFFTAAHAETFSFSVGGHHITISASHDCYRAACISVSIPALVTAHRKHSDDVVAAQDAAPAMPAPKAPAVVAPAPAPQITLAAPPVETRATVVPPAPPPSPPSAPKLAATGSEEVTAPQAPPPAEPVKIAASENPAEPMPVAPRDPVPVPKVVKVADTVRDDTPLGDWQTEGKVGAVRIEACGKALCGYLINPSSQAKAESILINMKPRGDSKSNGDSEWRGSIFSRASGNTYYATMTLKAANLLRVEACALGHFFCSGNNWTRITREPAALVTSRDDDSEPRS